MPPSELFDSDALVAVLESAASPVVVFDTEEVIRYVNPAAGREFGYEPHELVGERADVLIPPDRAAQLREMSRDWAEEPVGRPDSGGLDLWARRKDGSTFAVEVSVTPVSTSDGPMGLVAIVNISGRIDAERTARRLAKAHLAMAELNDAAARATDVGGLIAAALPTFTQVDEHARIMVVRADGSPVTARTAAALALADGRRTAYAGPEGPDHVVELLVLRDGEPLATIVMTSPDPLIEDPSVRAVLETMAANLSGALDRIAQRDRLRRLNRQRIDLFRRLLDAQDEERRRIADDVHDDSVQALAALQLRVGLLAHQAAQGDPRLVPAFTAIESELERVMVGLRTLLFELEPVSTSTALVDVVSEVLASLPIEGLTVQDLEIDWSAVPGEPDPGLLDLPQHLRGQAARILKEALRNVARHARASWARVVVAPDPVGVAIAVVDDGVGFPEGAETARSAPGHRGVAGMMARAAMCGGWCRLDRESDRTVLRFWLPRTGLAPDRVPVRT